MESSAALILASASPRRRKLLQGLGIPFTVEPSHVSEDLEGSPAPEQAAVELAERKARAVADVHRGSNVFVLAADTVVALGDDPGARLLGKPENEQEASAMLRALSNTRHRVVTGLCAVRCVDGALRGAFERTFVHMRALSPVEVAAYVESGEWRDKAGGYAIQESADAFVTQLEEGGFDNVVGLPVARTSELLRSLGLHV